MLRYNKKHNETIILGLSGGSLWKCSSGISWSFPWHSFPSRVLIAKFVTVMSHMTPIKGPCYAVHADLSDQVVEIL